MLRIRNKLTSELSSQLIEIIHTFLWLLWKHENVIGKIIILIILSQYCHLRYLDRLITKW